MTPSIQQNNSLLSPLCSAQKTTVKTLAILAIVISILGALIPICMFTSLSQTFFHIQPLGSISYPMLSFILVICATLGTTGIVVLTRTLKKKNHKQKNQHASLPLSAHILIDIPKHLQNNTNFKATLTNVCTLMQKDPYVKPHKKIWTQVQNKIKQNTTRWENNGDAITSHNIKVSFLSCILNEKIKNTIPIDKQKECDFLHKTLISQTNIYLNNKNEEALLPSNYAPFIKKLSESLIEIMQP